MRYVMMVLISMMSLSVNAAQEPKDFKLTCTTSVALVTLYAEGARFHFHLENGGGFANFPIFSGVVSPSLLPIVNRGAEDLKEFDGDVDISWDLAKCQVDGARPFLVACAGMGEITSPVTTKIFATSMGTSTSALDSLDVKAQVVNINLGLNTTGSDYMHYFIQFPFDANHCESN